MEEGLQESWVPDVAGSGHDIDHQALGVFTTTDDATARVGVRIGDQVADLAAAAAALAPEYTPVFAVDALNPLMAAGPPTWARTRQWITELLTHEPHSEHVPLHPVDEVTLHLPFEVGDYVDYYASLDHATNVGRIFRPDGEALMPNWKHLPVSYHGRAGSVIVSGTPIHRPCGQRKPPSSDLPVYGPTERLDIEAELGFVVGRTLPLGHRVPTREFELSVFGVTGLNDWSAREIQAWEYVPLGPNLAKSFATTISAWVTPLAALERAKITLPRQEPRVLPYLAQDPLVGYDIAVEVDVNGEVVSRPQYAGMYWTPAQMLAHMTVNGASLRTGDLFASGTISGPEREQRGCFLELSWGGREPWLLHGRERTFLKDGDEVVLRYSAPGQRGRLELGEVRGRIEPALG